MFAIRIGETEEHEFDFANPENQELMHLERLFEGTWGEWLDALGKRSITAQTSLVCLLRRRENPHLKMRDIIFKVRDLHIVDLDKEAKAGDEEQLPPEVDPENPTSTPSPTEPAGD